MFCYNQSMFKLVSQFEPSGDQPKAIAQLTEGIRSGMRGQTLLGGECHQGDQPTDSYPRA